MMHLRRAILLSVVVLVSFVGNARVQADPAQGADASKFLRFVDDGHGGGKLETAIVSYKDAQGNVVHLVAAVHIADPAYYKGLNETFTSYDALLYELVAPKDNDIPQPNAEPHSGIGMVQHWMKDALDLQFQLDGIDYTARNFVHADMDTDTFERMEADRGESLLGLMFKQMLKAMSDPDADNDQIDLPQLLAALQSPDRTRQLKLLLGRQMEHMEELSGGLSGDDGTVIITERNKACFEVLKKTLADGKKNIGIFYGAAHLPNMEKRLLDMGFKPTDTEWRTAWDMSAPAGAPAVGDGSGAPAPEVAPARPADRFTLDLSLEQIKRADGSAGVSATLVIHNNGDDAEIPHPVDKMALSFVVQDADGNFIAPIEKAKIDPGFGQITLKGDTDYKQKLAGLDFTTNSGLMSYDLKPGQTYRVIAIYRPEGAGAPGISSKEVVITLK